jgi:hypothetical protein
MLKKRVEWQVVEKKLQIRKCAYLIRIIPIEIEIKARKMGGINASIRAPQSGLVMNAAYPATLALEQFSLSGTKLKSAKIFMTKSPTDIIRIDQSNTIAE